MFLLTLFFIGLCVGSFLNVLIDRLSLEKNPLKGRSYCDNCKKTLKWFDMIPVLSFLILGGKCRFCKKKISFYYPVVEIITGLMFGITYLITSSNLAIDLNPPFIINYLFLIFIFSSLIVIFFSDLKYGIIPDIVLFPATLLTLIYNTSSNMFHFSSIYHLSFLNMVSSGIAGFAFFLALNIFTKGKGMGFGDVKLAFFMGVFLGFPRIISAFYVAFLTGAIIGIILILWKKKKLKGTTIPFGPFLVLGTILSFFWGEKILGIFLNFTLLP